jgi:hypothetical protein
MATITKCGNCEQQRNCVPFLGFQGEDYYICLDCYIPMNCDICKSNTFITSVKSTKKLNIDINKICSDCYIINKRRDIQLCFDCNTLHKINEMCKDELPACISCITHKMKGMDITEWGCDCEICMGVYESLNLSLK